MAGFDVAPLDEAFVLDRNEIIVSKTDLKGYIKYANEVFCRAAEIGTETALDAPHSLIRHPEMPRCIFNLMWTQIQSGKEIFAYVKNMTASGRYYWVLAHVTPSFDEAGEIVGYHSNRRAPEPEAVAKIETLYQKLKAEEDRHPNRKEGMLAGSAMLQAHLEEAGQSYDEYIWSLLP